MKLLIVIVNYRTADMTVDCLRSLAPELPRAGDTRVVVTDNASGDDSIARIDAAIRHNDWADWARLMPLEKNGGFAYGNNAAVRPALASEDPPRYVLLLNPDTIVRPGAIATLVEFMDSHPESGIAGSRLEDADGTPQASAFRFHTILSEWVGSMRVGLLSRLLPRGVTAPPVSDVACPTDWVAGASMILRREVFGAIGLLDEAYFMYFEEVDFCLRARRAKWPCWYVPQSRIVHLVGQASGVTDPTRANRRRPPYWFESRHRYFVKNHGRLYALLADLAFACGFSFWRLRRFIQRKPDPDPQHFLGDLLRHSLSFGRPQG